MRQIFTTALAAAALGTAGLLSGAATNAASAAPITAERLDAAGVKVEYTQYRRGWRGRGYHGPRYGYRGGYYRRGYGAAPLIGGLAAGALIGGAIASQAAPAPGYYAAPPDDDAVAYCMQRFKSYDPASGTYLGYDGQRHPCP
ncbi:BA14K family protein [Enterovirga aerilata]|uniref:Lectin-like protein BA14k n=1 Tax=Enterovirga aerilata TaxID=2730920 RepID=A0A849ILG9_9HYPH|nr:BA14K family protein [Enterovirga sp. DB1703]NNM74803.1 BA14K family protein [Enterovirga sp. DB1703]